jgi:hypothetical protein
VHSLTPPCFVAVQGPSRPTAPLPATLQMASSVVPTAAATAMASGVGLSDYIQSLNGLSRKNEAYDTDSSQ